MAGASSFPPRLRDSVQPPVFDVRLLAQLGVSARPVSGVEGFEGLRGPLYYDDLPAGVDASADLRRYAASRVDIRWLQRVVSQYRAVFGSGTGDRTGEIAGALAQSSRRWMSLTGASQIDAGSFRAYLESTAAERESLVMVQQLESLLASMRRLGLTGQEFRQARSRLLTPIVPEGAGADDFAGVLEQAARRGS